MSTGHSGASDESRDLCDALFQQLSQKIPDLQRSHLQKWCGISQNQEGRTRFAYINHRKTMSIIEVWCIGEPSELQSAAKTLEIKPRETIKGRWAERFQCRFFVEFPEQIPEVAEILYNISYKIS